MFNKLQPTTDMSRQLLSQRLEGTAAIVLVKMQLSVNKFNMVKGTPSILSKQWGMTIREFSLGTRILKKSDFIRKYTKSEYMLNPDLMYNGHEQQYFIVKHMWDMQTTKGLRE